MGVARAPRGAFAMLVFGSLSLVLIALAAPDEPVPVPVPAAQLASVALTDDDGDQALFTDTELAPGRPVTRCLEVRYAGPAGPGDVHLVADDVTGTLADALQVQVDRGTGGSFASCAGFTGSRVFDGTLTGLVDATEVGVSTGWVPGATDQRTYRITVEVPAGSEPGRTSTATFRWLVVPGSAPPPTTAPPTTAPPTTAPPTTAPPTTDPTTAPPTGAPPTTGPTTAPVPAPPPTAPPTSLPTAAPIPAPPTAAPTTQPAAGPPPTARRSPGGSAPRGAPAPVHRPQSAAGKLGAVVQQVFGDAAEVATGAARHGGVPIVALVAVFLFILFQDQLDRRDPKLALAPMTGDPYLYFAPDEPDDTGGPT